MSEDSLVVIKYLALAIAVVLISPFALICAFLFGPPTIVWFIMDRLGIYKLIVCRFDCLESDLVSLFAACGFLFSYIIVLSWLSTSMGR